MVMYPRLSPSKDSINLVALGEFLMSSCMMQRNEDIRIQADHRAAAPRFVMAALIDFIETVFFAGPNIPLSAVTSLVAAKNS